MHLDSVYLILPSLMRIGGFFFLPKIIYAYHFIFIAFNFNNYYNRLTQLYTS